MKGYGLDKGCVQIDDSEFTAGFCAAFCGFGVVV